MRVKQQATVAEHEKILRVFLISVQKEEEEDTFAHLTRCLLLNSSY